MQTSNTAYSRGGGESNQLGVENKLAKFVTGKDSNNLTVPNYYLPGIKGTS